MNKIPLTWINFSTQKYFHILGSIIKIIFSFKLNDDDYEKNKFFIFN